ncbi:MAG: hypothetical protein LUQ40_01300 [Methanomicrobiales archaeon]|nr:hypothetical protein [Methanomicrobiales archaeon]
MQKLRWQVLLALFLVALSALLYIVHFFIFHDPHHIFIYLLGDIAFLPLEVLFVTLVIDTLLERHERSIRIEKMNMVIGAFFSALGSDLLARFTSVDPQIRTIRTDPVIRQTWREEDFRRVSALLQAHTYECDIDHMDLSSLKNLLNSNQDFLLRLLENPSLLEHESFTELLRAIFHLAEELRYRRDFSALPTTDLKHLQGDIVRAYTQLAREWLEYMRYLKGNYPYLYSLAIRMNPFDENASPIVQ